MKKENEESFYPEFLLAEFLTKFLWEFYENSTKFLWEFNESFMRILRSFYENSGSRVYILINSDKDLLH